MPYSTKLPYFLSCFFTACVNLHNWEKLNSDFLQSEIVKKPRFKPFHHNKIFFRIKGNNSISLAVALIIQQSNTHSVLCGESARRMLVHLWVSAWSSTHAAEGDQLSRRVFKSLWINKADLGELVFSGTTYGFCEMKCVMRILTLSRK